MSCSSDVPDVTRGAELQFATAAQSRSSVSSTLNHEGAKFTIYGDMKFGGASSSNESTIVFNGVPVTFVNSQWRYGQLQYWFPNHEHSFVALHPADPTGTSDMNYQNNSLTFCYTLPEKFSDAQDLTVATHRRMYYAEIASSGEPVMLTFSHIMSRINFKVENDKAAENVEVTKIELVGVNQSGSFTITPAMLLEGSKTTDDYVSAWSGVSDKETLVADIKVNISEDESRPLFPDDNALFVIPQPDNKGVIMKITYTLTYENGKTEERTLAAETPIGGWKQGKVYTYSLSLSADIKAIEMNVSVNDWKEGAGNDVEVPRK